MAENNQASAKVDLEEKAETKSSGEDLAQVAEQLKSMNDQFSKQFQAQSEVNSAMQEQLKRVDIQRELQRQAAAPTVTSEDDESFLDLNPKDYERRIEKRVEDRIKAQRQQDLELNNTISALATEYPDIVKVGSDLNKKVVEVHNSLPKGMQDTAAGYELAASRAALSLGVVPRSMQKGTSDFSLSGSRSSSKKEESSEKLDEKTIATAKLMGIDVDNKATRARLEEYAKRKTWTRYK